MKILVALITVIALNLIVILLHHFFLGEVTVKGIVIMLTIELIVTIFAAILYYGSET